MEKVKRNRIYVLLLAFLLLITTIFSIGGTKVKAETVTPNFANTNVLDDLKSSKDFNILDYPFYTSEESEMYIMNVVEYCYSFDVFNQQNYGLYLYVYNPNGIEINTVEGVNKVQMAVGYNDAGAPNRYEKFDLKFCSKAEENLYKGLFYKFKVIDHAISDGSTMVQRVKSSARRYDISGIEILAKGVNFPTEYRVGGTYTFTGYAKGYGANKNAESTLVGTVNQLETVELEVHNTYYRTGEYETNHRHDLTSVYFAVPNRYFEEYGKLQKIKAEWYEYVTTPICITSNQTVYDLLNPYLGKDTRNTEIALQLYTGWQEMIGSSGHYYKYNWAYNCDRGTSVVNESCKKICYLFSTNGEDISNYVLSAERLQEYVENYNRSFDSGYIDIPGKEISRDLFEITLSSDRTAIPYVDDVHHKLVEFDADNTFDMLNYDSTHSGWHKFFAGLFGLGPTELDQNYKDISPIKIVTEEDMNSGNIAKNLLIDDSEEALDEFIDFYNKSLKEDKTVVLFRFAQTDYESLPVIAYDWMKGKNLSGSYGKDTYIVTESVFLNFDIIELTFNKEGEYTIIPVVSSPVDIYNDITIPESQIPWWYIILGILVLILALWLLSVTGILPLLFKLIIWIILLPFKIIKALIQGGVKAHKKRKLKEKKKLEKLMLKNEKKLEKQKEE